MNHRFPHWKRVTRWVVSLVLALDAVLLLYAWVAAGSNPRSRSEQLRKLKVQHALLKADVGRADGIRNGLPAVEGECNKFYREQLLDAATGNSTVVADLGQIAGHAGLRAPAVTYKQHGLDKRGVLEISVTATVEGDYPALVRFINGLERSKSFYLLDSLALDQHTGGGIKLNMQFRSYFRS